MNDKENEFPKTLYKYSAGSTKKLGQVPVATIVVDTESQEQLGKAGGFLPVGDFYRKHVSLRYRAARAIAGHWSRHWQFWINTTVAAATCGIALIAYLKS